MPRGLLRRMGNAGRLLDVAASRGVGENARAHAVTAAFDRLGLDQLVAFTVPHNLASRRVMEKLRMTLDPEAAFDHPRVDAARYPELVHHVVYRLSAREWRAGATGST